MPLWQREEIQTLLWTAMKNSFRFLDLLVGLLLAGCAVVAMPAPTALPSAVPVTPASPTPIPTVFLAVPMPTPGGDGPRILTYTLHATDRDGRPAVELAWKAEGESVEIWTYTRGGLGGQYRRDLPVEGAVTIVSQPGAPRRAQFQLVARGDGAGDAPPLDTQGLTYAMPCAPEWFAGDCDVCPLDAPASSPAVIQYFEHGKLLWLETPGVPAQTFWVFLDGNRPTATAFQFAAPPPAPDGALPANDSPPPGLYAPRNDFALLWNYATDTAGEEAPFRDSLGWATTAELSFETRYQCHSQSECMLRDYDGGILHTYYVVRFGLYWKEQ